MKQRNQCRYALPDRPCRFHKETGTLCHECTHFEKIQERVWIVKLGAMGDVLRTSFLLEGLRKRHPKAQITWVTKKESFPFFTCNNDVDRLLDPFDAAILAPVEKIDIVYGLDMDPVACSIVARTNAEKGYGYSLGENGLPFALNPAADTWMRLSYDDEAKKANRSTYQEIMVSITELHPSFSKSRYPIHFSDKEQEKADAWRSTLGKYPVLGINLGGGTHWSQKVLSHTSLSGALDQLVRKGFEGSIVLMGGSECLDVLDHLHDAHPGCYLLPTNLSVRDFAATISACDTILTADTLAMHIALAVDTRVLVNFGPTAPWEIEFYGLGEAIHAELDCIACYQSQCRGEEQCVHIPPTRLVKALQKQLDLSRPQRRVS